jgi:hypothetical protein
VDSFIDFLACWIHEPTSLQLLSSQETQQILPLSPPVQEDAQNAVFAARKMFWF